MRERPRSTRPVLLLLFFFLLFGAASTAQAGDFCSDAPYYGVIDGNVLGTPPIQITIDTDCTFQNWPASNPLTTTINFQTNDPTIYLIIFNNVQFIGNMACANVDHRIWFANGSDYGSGNACQDLFIPVESIDKQSPAATANVGVPFTYTLTLPSMQLSGDPSPNDLHTVTLWDDLTATGADLTYVNLTAHYKSSGAPVTLIPEDNPNSPGGVWTPKNLSYKPISLIHAGEQIVVELTVVLDDSPANVAGKQFINTAKWIFGRLIDGVFYEPLPGEWGVSGPMTIAEPNLVLTKTSSETALNLGIPSTFTIDVQNTGGGDAWNATVVDQLPSGASGGMCDTDPSSAPGGISASIVAADGSLVSTLSLGTDYSYSYSNSTGAPPCQLNFSMLSDKSRIAPDQHLLITYQAQLDGGTQNGAELTNVAGVTRWYSGATSISGRRQYDRGPLTDGTPGVLDFQDNQTITAALSGYYFQKTVENLTSHEIQAVTAAPGDRLRYKLRLFNIDHAINGISITDQLDPNRFILSSFSPVSLPAGATYSFNSVTGMLSVSGSPGPLNLSVGNELVIEFEITLSSSLANNTSVSNQAYLSSVSLPAIEPSDDPYLHGIAMPLVQGDEDPTVVRILTPGPLAKSRSQIQATIGDQFTYRITVPAVQTPVPLYDVRILDNLASSAADMRFVGARVVSGGIWTLSNTGTGTNLVLEDLATGLDIPANGQAVIEITVELQNTTTNRSGLFFKNTASYTYNRSNGDSSTQTTGVQGSDPGMTVVEPALTAIKTVSFASPAGKPAGDPARISDVLEYQITVPNRGGSTAFDSNIVDTLPAYVSLVPGSASAAIDGVAVSGFVADPTSMAGGAVAWGRQNGDNSLDIPAGKTLVLTYQVTVVSVTGAPINNRVYVDWTSQQDALGEERTGSGCPATTAPNNYCYGPATVGVSTVDNTSIVKSVLTDSYAEVPASTTDPIVRVGDSITYQLILNLQEYTTQNVVVEDALPAGMALQSFTISGGPNFIYSLAAQPAAGATGTLRWQFGDITNQPSNDSTPVDPLVIRYVATVVTDAPPAGVGYATSILRDNLAKLSYTGGDPAIYPNRLTSAERVEVRQPQMSTISKVDLGTGRFGAGTAADPYRVTLATDFMKFRLSSCNDGLAPAYGVELTDQLASELDEMDLAANPPIVKIGASTLNSGSGYTYTAPARGGEMRIALSSPVNPGQCVTVDYNIGFHTDLTNPTTWSNQARVAEYRSLPSSGRLYTPTAAAQVWMSNEVSAQPLLNTLASPAEATIGEEVVYRIKVPVSPMNAALNNVVVSDTLNGALTYESASAVDLYGNPVALPTGVTSGQVSMTIANIPAGQQAIITLRSRVANNQLANNDGVPIRNTASCTYTGLPAGTVISSTSAPLTIVEPLVTVARTVSATSPRAGDILTYSLTFTAAGAGAGDNYSKAFDLTIEENLGLGLAYQPGSAKVNGAVLADPQTNGADGLSAAQTLMWSPANGIDVDIAEGTTVTVTYQVHVLDVVQPGQTLTSSVIGRWTGLDGDQSAIERSGSGTPAVNDYFTQPAALSMTSAFAVSFEKSVVKVTPTNIESGANASPGDVLRYTLVLANKSIARLDNASVVDVLAAQFVPGSLQFVSVPAGVVTSSSNPSGGANGTGLINISNLTLAAEGDPNGGDTMTIEFTATLAPVIDSGTLVLNQAELRANGLLITKSDDPNVNGVNDPNANGVADPTRTLITSSPAFEIWKTSQDLTNDPSVLRAGDVLRYTITIKNTGNENAVNVVLRDQIPANTAYVAGSATMNGKEVGDPAVGVSPLQDGLPIHAPEIATAGVMPADASATVTNVATVTFEVRVNSDVLDGTIISNQGFVTGNGAGSGPIPEHPSDDPATATINDPTRDVVGSLPLVDAQKTVQIVDDKGTVGVVDPGDVLRYTITITNLGSLAATGVVFTDAVPVNTTYQARSTTLNGQEVADQPAVGNSPLINGIPVSSADLTPPTAGNGTLSPGGSAVITFDVRVNDGVATDTVISNQGVVSSNEQADEPTDADGIDSNGDQPTEVVVGPAQLVSITKEVAVVGGGTAEPGAQLEYLVRVTNIGSLAATGVVVTDNLGLLSGKVSYVTGSALLNGSPAGVTYQASVLTVTYPGDLQPGAIANVRFRVQIDPAVAIGTTINNTATVIWNVDHSASASVSLDVGGTPGTAVLNGRVWHDANLDKSYQNAELPLAGWSVELYRDNQLLATVLTDERGTYRLGGLVPNQGTSESYELHFLAPGAGSNTASLGYANSRFSDNPQGISGITVASGDNLQNLNLPISPNGTVYNSVMRIPVAGARLALLNAATMAPLPSRCFDDPNQQDQITEQYGFYKFDLNFSDPACPAGGAYLIEVTPPPTGYSTGASRIIPPASDETTQPFSVPACPGSADDAVPATAQYCEVTSDASVPPLSVPPRTAGTTYYLHFTLSNGSVPGQSQIFNNPIPIDPELNGAVAITKTTSMLNVTKGQLVPYTITVTNVLGVPLYYVGIVDRFPAGFKYVKNSARLDGVPSEPTSNGRELLWDGFTLQVNEKHTIQLLLAVGAGVTEDEYVNRAQVLNTANGEMVSGEATATVRVIPDPTFDCTDVIGKVFDDANLNGYQDDGEHGLAGVRVVTVRGLIATSDKNGRFHITCAVVPDADRGSNFILKLDDRTLPTGYRLTTENPRVERATRGKMLRFNFGATIHRLVAMDISDGAFEPNGTELRLQWQPRIGRLLDELKKGPSVLRLSYLADIESKALVKQRLKELQKEIANRWGGGYQLNIETEVFWRRGSPP